MREQMQGSGWLLVGALAAIGVWLGLWDGVAGALDQALPGTWRRGALGGLVFAGACALYFRSHWAATLGTLQHRGPAGLAAARRIAEAAGDLERSAHVVADNLVEVEPHVSDATGAMYLEGARAHAAKLQQLTTRLRNIAAALRDPSGDA